MFNAQETGTVFSRQEGKGRGWRGVGEERGGGGEEGKGLGREGVGEGRGYRGIEECLRREGEGKGRRGAVGGKGKDTRNI